MHRVGRAVEQLMPLAKAGDGAALGELLELYRNYLQLLARLQLGRRLQGKVDSLDLVQETFLDAHTGFARFRGTTEQELLGWLRQVLSCNTASLVRRYYGTKRRGVDRKRDDTVLGHGDRRIRTPKADLRQHQQRFAAEVKRSWIERLRHQGALPLE